MQRLRLTRLTLDINWMEPGRHLLLTREAYIAKSGNDDLKVLAELIETGRIKPVIDRTFSLNEVPEAVRYVAG